MCLLASFCILKKRSDLMGRPKGGKNKYWSKEEKVRIVMRVENGEESFSDVAKEEKVFLSLLGKWLKEYREKGEEGLENKRKPGNPLVRYQRRKNLTELEQLQFDNMKLRIENARLKKGYTNEEAMSIKQKRSSKKNTQ